MTEPSDVRSREHEHSDRPAPELEALDDDRVSALEARVFRSIGAARHERSARRRRITTVGSVAAGLLALAVVVGPLVGGAAGSGAASSAAGSSSEAGGLDLGESGAESAPQFAGGAAQGSAEAPGDSSEQATGREIVSTASATLEAESVPDAIAALSAIAVELGGYVESSRTSETTAGADPYDPSLPAPLPEGAGSVSIRVPADRLADAHDSLSTVGRVTASSIERRDVTTEAIDLRAQVDAAQASVDRLTELIAQAGSLPDLLAAESALADRQASLESSQQQLAALEGQVSLATLTVTVLPGASPASAQPTGFLDGLLAGWNGLVVAGNGALIGIGFLLPWLLVATVIALVVVTIRRRRGPPEARATADRSGTAAREGAGGSTGSDG
ncbi:DUF4349 domain-containing protein [Rathayibacter sp. VKM Ac-2856]|uniref:DUF4349 domain-containing protein n=1 Tax=unclassified Rathayibacter TaxID=2609250 RepID=UPI001565E86A|nr:MULTISPECIES: DUF4349 domain-containing protein [unclassified Rathayibacter]NQX06563.1 DUF4349 domain-containing protein [Rathayibacter sp. VKM Ac-2858]NQX21730.1 DUF4349 domain-containing protein [Rathayibacter sp. VKM Ac-2856]